MFEYRALPKFVAQPTQQLNTALLSQTWSSLHDQAVVRVLDLSCAQPESIRFFSEYSTYLTILDIIDELLDMRQDICDENQDIDRQLLKGKFTQWLPAQDSPYDLILLWDIVNYMDRNILKDFSRHLTGLCHERTVIYGFIYTGTSRYERPAQYKIDSAAQVLCVPGSGVLVDNQAISSVALEKYMPYFKIDRSRLMSSGLQETLLRCV